MNKIPIHKVLKAEVMKRDGYRCRYCGADVGPFEIDHIVPEVLGGPASMWNLATACENCNRSKGSKVGIFPYPVGFFDSPSMQYDEFMAWEQIRKNLTFKAVILLWFWSRYTVIRAVVFTIAPLSIMFFIYDWADVYGLENMNFPFSPLWFCLIPMAFMVWERYMNYKMELREEFLQMTKDTFKSGG